VTHLHGLVWCAALVVGLAACGGKSAREEEGGASETGGNAGAPPEPTGGRGGSNGVGGAATMGGSSSASGGTGAVTMGGTSSASGGTGAGAGAVTMGGSSSASGGTGVVAGSSSGGGAGASGSGGTGVGICILSEQCRVIDDCCTCAAIGPDESAPLCPIDCAFGTCPRNGAGEPPSASCVAGRCVLDLSCNTRYVSCDAAPPRCPAGSVPSVAGSCWTGGCLPVTECSSVASCEVCEASGTTCINTTIGLGDSFHCVLPPPGCDGTCSCMQTCRPNEQCIEGEPLTCYYDCITC
jgi:hypothetical protein